MKSIKNLVIFFKPKLKLLASMRTIFLIIDTLELDLLVIISHKINFQAKTSMKKVLKKIQTLIIISICKVK